MENEVGRDIKTVVVEEEVKPLPRDPRLLLTNDDGIQSPGIRLLAERLNPIYEVVVAAPARDMSGSGTGIGRFDAREGIDLTKAGWDGVEAYTIEGPPGLAVMAGALGAFGTKPDLVVSGINAGVNTGHSVLHSGTVGAVLTARTFGSHGLAISLSFSDPWQWATAAEVAVALAAWTLAQEQERIVINANVPGLAIDEIRGFKWAKLDEFGVFRVATANYQSGRLQFEVRGSNAEAEPSSDTALVGEGFVTLTPLTTVEPAPFPSLPAQDIFTALMAR
ncbi:MAG: 5'/3'-nucleotidase SurE [Actinobacteria bacterium]|nr:5'/3'-nucleotidase SurE [Actinomycetota bacterium]